MVDSSVKVKFYCGMADRTSVRRAVRRRVEWRVEECLAMNEVLKFRFAKPIVMTTHGAARPACAKPYLDLPAFYMLHGYLSSLLLSHSLTCSNTTVNAFPNLITGRCSIGSLCMSLLIDSSKVIDKGERGFTGWHSLKAICQCVIW